MKTSTKILIVLTIALLVANIFLTPYLLRAIVPTETGFQFAFGPLAWVALVFQILFNLFFIILFFKFLRTQKLRNAIFFSVFPLTLLYASLLVYLTDVKNLDGVTAESVRASLNISATANSYNNYLWAGLLTIVYLLLFFFILYVSCRPLNKVEKVTNKLSDGRLKDDNVKIGGGKQFREIENSLNKINFNYKEKDNKLKKANVSTKNSQDIERLLGKNLFDDVRNGHTVNKKATLLYCNLKYKDLKTLTLEENFNYINSYIKIVSPLVKRYNGFVDTFFGDGILAVFEKSRDCIECAHTIIRAVEVKNKNQKHTIEPKVSIATIDLSFGVVEQEDKKVVGIISDKLTVLSKIDEINSYINTKMLFSKDTLNDLPQKFEFDYRYTGNLSLENDDNIALYESLEVYRKSIRDKLKKLRKAFESGVRAYNVKDYEFAKENFETVLRSYPDDKASYVYFNKCVEKMKKPAWL